MTTPAMTTDPIAAIWVLVCLAVVTVLGLYLLIRAEKKKGDW